MSQTHNIGIEMNQKELSKTFMIIFNLVCDVFYKLIQRFNG